MTVLDLHPSNCCMVVLSEDVPLMVKELWTTKNTEPETNSTYQYVIDLKDKLKQTCELARGERRKSHEKYRIQYTRKARNGTFKVGDEVVYYYYSLLIEINC